MTKSVKIYCIKNAKNIWTIKQEQMHVYRLDGSS